MKNTKRKAKLKYLLWKLQLVKGPDVSVEVNADGTSVIRQEKSKFSIRFPTGCVYIDEEEQAEKVGVYLDFFKKVPPAYENLYVVSAGKIRQAGTRNCTNLTCRRQDGTTTRKHIFWPAQVILPFREIRI